VGKGLTPPCISQGTDATIRNLREACNIWEQRCQKDEEELAEAKAEIERLRSLVKGLLDVDRARNVDAEIGRLVWGMRPGTRLEKGEEFYAAVVFAQKPIYMFGLTSDPAEALRAIQEVGDA